MQISKDKFLLTIGLPVYNDPEALKETIKSLIPELSRFSDLVEIVVSDNCSVEDSKVDFVRSLEIFPNSTVVRQISNLGFAGNLMAISELARGTYIWFIGAGDTLVPGAAPGILDVLGNKEVSWGTVMGLFNYHRHEEYVEPKSTVLYAKSSEDSTLTVYNHAISLNIFRTEIFRSYTTCSAHTLSFLNRSKKPFGLSAGRTEEVEDCHWPHLEAVGQFALENSDKELVWFEYLRKSILLNSNLNGNWDKGPAAMRIFSQWSEVVAFTSYALSRSKWIRNLAKELRGLHLLRFTFMIRQDSTLKGGQILLHQRKMIVGKHVRLAVLLICLLPRLGIKILVAMRRRFWRQAPAFQSPR